MFRTRTFNKRNENRLKKLLKDRNTYLTHKERIEYLRLLKKMNDNGLEIIFDKKSLEENFLIVTKKII